MKIGLLNATLKKKKPAPKPVEAEGAAAEIHRSLEKTVKKDLERLAAVEGDYALDSVVLTLGGREVKGYPAEGEIVTNFPDPALDEKVERLAPNSPEVTRGFKIAPTGPVSASAAEDGLLVVDDPIRERPVDYAARLEAAAALPGKFGTVLPPDAQENLPAMKADDQSLENLALGKASTKALMRAGFETIGDLRAFEGDWTSLAGIGAKGAEKIVETLAAYADAPEADDEPEAERDPYTDAFKCLECGSRDLVNPETGKSTFVYPGEAPSPPSLDVSFKGLVLASDDLKVSGLETYKTIPGRQLFEGADDDGTVIAGLRLLSDYPKILVLLEDGADYVYAAHRFAERYRVPCLTSIPF